MSDWDRSDAPLNGIAIVGLAGRFPGADTIEAFWRNLAGGVESITVFTDDELRAAGVDRATLENPDYVKARGLISHPEQFDAAFFGISQREAELMDPQQRLFLEACWQALEHAALDPLAFPGLIGVWGGLSTGMTNNTYLLSNLHARKDVLEPEDMLAVMLGNENDYLTTRVSYKLHLRGPSVNVQSACSTSLVAVAQACQALLTWQCDAALAGGVSVSYPQHEGYLFQEGGIGSPDGHCRAFDAQAQGTVFSNGVGVVTLRRLEDALADRQTIYAVIRGVGMNNDGSSKVSFAAPSVDGQAEVIAMAHSAADVTPDTIGFIEAHGTGTPLGDPIEVTALTKAFRAGGATGTQFCGLGSVKTNFGHLDSAAGVTGLIKTTLALYHEQMPPTLHFEQPNPKCNLPSSPFFVNTTLRPWPRGERVRRAGVSSFGIGGTNAHVVLEEAPPVPAREANRQAASTLLVLSAKTATALDAAAAQLAQHLDAHADADLADTAYTLQAGRQPFAHRRALVCGSRVEAVAALRASLSSAGASVSAGAAGAPVLAGQAGIGRAINGAAAFGSRSIAFMFSGGGTQYVDMARQLLDAAPVFQEEIERCLDILRPTRDVRRVLFPVTPEERADAAARLEQPSWGLPALFAVEYALAQQWIACGVKPDALIGHSMGEYTAACLAGVMSLEDALSLVLLRGRLFETLPPGEMLGVPLAEAEVRPVLDEVARETARGGAALAIAAVNAPASCVVSGAPEALAAFAARMADQGVECRRLHIAVAAHSPMVDPILAEFERFFRTITLRAPSIPVVSNVTGTWLTADEACAPEYWAKHLRQTVRFYEGLGTLLAEPNRVLIEAGPGQTLCGFARQHPAKGERHVIQASLRHPKDAAPDLAFLQQAVGRLWTMGVAIDWSAYAAGRDWRRIPLPTYPFEKTRYLIDVAPMPGGARNDAMSAETTSLTPPAPAATPPVRARADRIRDRLTELLHKLSGLPLAEIDPRVSFLEMGFDSLFLTQASLRFKSEFKVKVTFRQLFEEAPTLDALAHYIDGKLPPDAFPAPAAAAPAAPAAPIAQAASAAAQALTQAAPQTLAPAPALMPMVAPSYVPAQMPALAFAPAPQNAGAVERVIQQQLQLMAEQLRIVAGAPVLVADAHAAQAAAAGTAAIAAVTAPAPATVSTTTALDATTAATHAQPQIAALATPAATPTSTATPEAIPMAFGPFRGIDRSVHGLTVHQQRHLDALITRYARRTQGSKTLTESQRARLADPRAVSGFRKVWKEIIYQLATVRSEGSRMWDVDGNEYIDLTSGFGVNLFGYAPPFVTDAVRTQLEQGIELGTLSPLAKEAADLICDMTGMERATFANTGSEAISGAVRAVRTVTGRDWIAVFDDEYHGIAEEVLVKSVGTRGSYRSAPAAPGIPDHLVDKVIVLHYNDPRSIDIIRERADEIAGVIIEPVQNRHPDFRPVEMIRAVRQVTTECDIPLIFDEMITGFRLHPRGAQGYFGVDVDVACYGKIMSGGLPIAAIAGKAEYLDAFDGGPWRFGDDSYPEGGVTFFGGTFTRNPLSLAACVAALRYLKAQGPELYDRLNAASDRFADDVNALFRRYGAPMHLEHCGSICNVLFKDDNPLTRLLHYYLRDKGVHIYDRPFFISIVHSEADFAFILKAWEDTLAEMQAAHFFGDPSTPSPDGTPGGGARASSTESLAGALAGVGAGASDASGARALASAGGSTDVVPFTDAQLEVWLGASMGDAASRGLIEIVSVDLRGPLDERALDRAVAQVVARHESLRMTVVTAPLGFRLAPHMHVPIARRDLSTVPAEARDAAVHDAVLAGSDSTPFDLAHGPLLRLTLITLAADHHLLVMAAHHLVCDGWSFGLVLHDLSVCYSAEAQGTRAALAEPMQASEFAGIAQEIKASEEAADAEAFWLKQFATLPDPLELPADRPRPAVRSHGGSRLALEIDAELARAARTLSTRQRTTMFATLLGVFQTLIYRLSGQSDFVVGIPVAGQSSLGGRDLVAHCVNFVPLRCTVDGDRTFLEHLALLRGQALDINEYQQFTYGSLLAKLRLPRDPSRNTLVPVSFTVEPAIEDLQFHGLRARTLTAPRTTAKRELDVNIMETAAGLQLEVDFNTDLFDASTVARWLDSYRALLASAVAAPEQRLSALTLLSDAERTQLLVEWNDTAAEYPRDRTIHALFEECAARTPEALAVTYGGTRLTYRALDARANQIAHLLRQHGVAADARVGVCVERSTDMVAALLGVLKAGGAYVPLDPSYPADRTAFVLEDARASVLLTESSLLDTLGTTTARVICLDREAGAAALPAATPAITIASGAETTTRTPATATSLAYVIYTSGSTGKPKGVQIEHRAVVNLLSSMRRRPGLSADDVLLAVTTLSFDIAGLELFLPLTTGATLVIAPRLTAADPRLLQAELIASGATVMQATPVTWRMLVDAGWEGDARLKILCGGEALSRELAAALLPRGGELWNLYGPTETTIWSAGRRITDARQVDIGGPIDNTELLILEASGQPAPIGVAGELLIGGDGLARGYFERPELTEDRFVPHPFKAGHRLYRTGDRARWTPRGTVEFLGRGDQQIKLRGFRVELGEIEATFRTHPAVREAVVLLREDTPGDQRLVGYVTTTAAVSAADLRAHATQTLPDYFVPAGIVFLDAWPLTPNGKIDRKALPAPAIPATSDAPALAAPVLPPTEEEEAIAAIWRAVLGVPQVGLHEDFFRTGGHSLLALQVAGRIDQRFGVALGPAALFTHPTVAALARFVRERRVAATPVMAPKAAVAPPSRQDAAQDARPSARDAAPRDDARDAARVDAPGVRLAPAVPAAVTSVEANGSERHDATVNANVGETDRTSGHTNSNTSGSAGVSAGAGADADRDAAIVRREESAPRAFEVVASSQVLVRLAPGGSGTPFFWVHGVGGEVFSYMKISRLLGRTRPVYGFTADWTQLTDAAARQPSETPTVEAMAAYYVRELRAVQPNGPYHLGGFCGAAMLALEMARQLEAAGQTVGLLAALDCNVDSLGGSPTGARAGLAFLRNVPRWLREDAMLSGAKDLMGRLRSGLRRVAGRWRGGDSPAAGVRPDDVRDELGMWRFPDYQLPMLEAHHQAIRTYQPKPFRGRVTLFLPRAAPLLGPWPTGPDPEWEQLARGGVTVHHVPGSHATMLGDPFAAGLATQLNAAIDEAERQARRPHLVKPRPASDAESGSANARLA